MGNCILKKKIFDQSRNHQTMIRGQKIIKKILLIAVFMMSVIRTHDALNTKNTQQVSRLLKISQEISNTTIDRQLQNSQEESRKLNDQLATVQLVAALKQLLGLP